jgi:hypothetical protein
MARALLAVPHAGLWIKWRGKITTRIGVLKCAQFEFQGDPVERANGKLSGFLSGGGIPFRDLLYCNPVRREP